MNQNLATKVKELEGKNKIIAMKEREIESLGQRIEALESFLADETDRRVNEKASYEISRKELNAQIESLEAENKRVIDLLLKHQKETLAIRERENQVQLVVQQTIPSSPSRSFAKKSHDGPMMNSANMTGIMTARDASPFIATVMTS